METYTEADIRRFYEYVAVGKPDECWEWLGGTAAGYGVFRFHGHQITASRFAFWITTGHHPGELLVCHSCDNSLCVNPNHLWLGTCRENKQDASEKGRLVSCMRRGEMHPNAKLSTDEVLEIRTKQAVGISRSQLAIEYNVSQVTIDNIISRRSWKHV